MAVAISASLIAVTLAPSSSGAATAVLPTPATPVLSARRLPHVMLGATADARYASVLDPFLTRAAGSTCAVVTEHGRLVYARNPHDSLAPASTVKLLTAIAAIEVLGADRTLATTALAARAPKEGVVAGDLFLVGEGDPLLTTKGYSQSLEDPDQITEDFAAVADAIVAAGITEIHGDIVGDDTHLDRTRWLPGWPTRYQIGGTVAPLSALLVNDGQTGFTDTPDATNAARKPGDPPALAAATLRTLLIARGVTVSGGASAGPAPSSAVELAQHQSRPVGEIVGEMLTDSDNTTAEILTRVIGRVAGGSGTTEAGTEAIVRTIRSLGLPADTLVMKDGSGLDGDDRVSCDLLLAAVTRLPDYPQLVDKLPVAGRSGTLRRRLTSSPATAKVRAKTGTLNNVNALAGFAQTSTGLDVHFSMIENGVDSRGTGVTDGFADRVVTYGDGLALQSYQPLPAS